MTKNIFLVLALVTILFSAMPVRQASSATDYNKLALSQDQAKAEQLVNSLSTTAESLSVTEVLGPLAPVALSPFFGITCLSATSMLSEKTDVIPNNKLITGNEALNNPAIFAIFLVLTLVTSLPKLTTVTKAFAQSVDQLEAYAGIISYLVIVYFATSGSNVDTDQVVYSAGIFTFTKHTLLMAACIINIIVINTVKFFFELLVLISPIPTVDAMFEAANKAVTAGLAILYAFSPALAFAINLVLFLICLVIFNWARKRIKYYRSILVGPAARTLFKIKSDPNSSIQPKITLMMQDSEAVVKVFPEKKIGKIKKKDAVCIVKSADNLLLVKLKLFGSAVIQTLEVTNLNGKVSKGLLSNSIIYTDSEDKTVYKFTFSKVYNDYIDKIASQLNIQTAQL